jgi:hypothetical protein
MGHHTQILLSGAALSVLGSHTAAQQTPNSFRLQEATIASIHAALAAGQLSCTELTKLYIWPGSMLMTGAGRPCMPFSRSIPRP